MSTARKFAKNKRIHVGNVDTSVFSIELLAGFDFLIAATQELKQSALLNIHKSHYSHLTVHALSLMAAHVTSEEICEKESERNITTKLRKISI